MPRSPCFRATCACGRPLLDRKESVIGLGRPTRGRSVLDGGRWRSNGRTQNALHMRWVLVADVGLTATRNVTVLDHLPEPDRAAVKRRLRRAWTTERPGTGRATDTRRRALELAPRLRRPAARTASMRPWRSRASGSAGHLPSPRRRVNAGCVARSTPRGSSRCSRAATLTAAAGCGSAPRTHRCSSASSAGAIGAVRFTSRRCSPTSRGSRFITDPSPTWAPTNTGRASISRTARVGRRLSCSSPGSTPEAGAKVGYT